MRRDLIFKIIGKRDTTYLNLYTKISQYVRELELTSIDNNQSEYFDNNKLDKINKEIDEIIKYIKQGAQCTQKYINWYNDNTLYFCGSYNNLYDPFQTYIFTPLYIIDTSDIDKKIRGVSYSDILTILPNLDFPKQNNGWDIDTLQYNDKDKETIIFWKNGKIFAYLLYYKNNDKIPYRKIYNKHALFAVLPDSNKIDAKKIKQIVENICDSIQLYNNTYNKSGSNIKRLRLFEINTNRYQKISPNDLYTAILEGIRYSKLEQCMIELSDPGNSFREFAIIYYKKNK